MLATTASRKPYLEHLALLLENEGEFYRVYQTKSEDSHVRNLIDTWGHRLRVKDSQLLRMGPQPSTDEREILRRYLNDKWNLTQKVGGNRGVKPAPFLLFDEEPATVNPAPVKVKPTTELATDWASLPDGTVLITASGAKYTKGPGTIDQGCHPVSISSMKEQAAKGFVVGVSHRSRGSWNRWNKDGLSCSDTGKVYDTMTGHSLVSYELPVKHDPKAAKPVDYSKLPDGTRLFTKGGGEYIKGAPPPWLEGLPENMRKPSFYTLSAPSGRPVYGYQVRDGKFAGWQNWRADGTLGSVSTNVPYLELTGYDATPSGGLVPATDQPPSVTQPQPKEITMNAIIDITTKTLINGQDIANYSNAQLYEIIAQQEKKLAELDAIKNKPKALKKELADRQAGIDALVVHLDSRDDGAK